MDRHEAGDDWLLLTAWARSMAHRAVRAVAGSARFTVERLCRVGRLAPAAVPRFAALLKVLAEFGLAAEEDGAWRLAPARLPSPQAILRSILAAHPERGAETVMAARLSRDLVAALRSGEPLRFSKGVQAHARAASPLLPLAAALVETLTAGRASPLALLLVDPEGELVPALLPLIRDGALTVAVTGWSRKPWPAWPRAARACPACGSWTSRPPSRRAASTWRCRSAPWRRGDLRRGRGSSWPGCCAPAPRPSPSTPSRTPSPPCCSRAWRTASPRRTGSRRLPAGGPAPHRHPRRGGAVGGLGPAGRRRSGRTGRADPARPADTELLADLADRLRGRGHAVRIDPAAAAAEGDTVLLPLMLDTARDPVAFLTKAILAVRAEAEALPAKSTLWLVARCGKLNGKADGGRGLAEALAAFARTLANEYSALAIRFAHPGPALPDEAAAAALAGLIGSVRDRIRDRPRRRLRQPGGKWCGRRRRTPRQGTAPPAWPWLPR